MCANFVQRKTVIRTEILCLSWQQAEGIAVCSPSAEKVAIHLALREMYQTKIIIVSGLLMIPHGVDACASLAEAMAWYA